MAFVTLAAFSAAAGVLILLAFKAATRRRSLRGTRRKLRAQLLAIRLFADSPALIVRSQGGLFLWTARYLALLLPAFLLAGIPLLLAWDHLDAIWGRAPLAQGDTVILTARVSDPATTPSLTVPDWIVVESPAVHAVADREVSWRLRILRAGEGDAIATAGTERAVKRIEARPGLHYLRERQSATGGPIEWLQLRYPPSELIWPVWFFVISTVTALAFRRRLHVTL